MRQRSVKMRVGHFFDAEGVQHLIVGSSLHALEFVNGHLTVHNRDEVHEFLVLVDVDIKLLD